MLNMYLMLRIDDDPLVPPGFDPSTDRHIAGGIKVCVHPAVNKQNHDTPDISLHDGDGTLVVDNVYPLVVKVSGDKIQHVVIGHVVVFPIWVIVDP